MHIHFIIHVLYNYIGILYKVIKITLICIILNYCYFFLD